jgi:DNA-binding PadR family transcriptional regulator
MRHHIDDSGQNRVHEHGQRGERGAHRHGRGGFERGRGGHRGRGFGGPFDGGRRANRGDVRAAVLALLDEQPMHGYQIIQELSSRSDGAWTPSPGSIYPALQLLQDEGMVTAAEADGKRVFTLTAAGREQAAARGDGPLPWEAAARGEGDTFGQLRQAVGQVGAAVRQIGLAASEQQVAKAIAVLATTRRELYRILAEDDTAEAPEAGTPGA